MQGRIFIKPTFAGAQDAPPMKVRKPVGGHLAAEGEWVNPESYWLRRLADGDVVQTALPAEPVAKAGAVGKEAK